MGLQVEVVHVDVARRSRKRRAVRAFRGELLSPQAWSLAGGFLAPRDEEPASPPLEPSPPPLALSPVEERVSATSTVSLEEAGL